MQPVLGVWDFNVTRDIVRCNAAMADLFGLDPEKAARGLPLASYLASIHPQDAPRIEQRVADAARALDIYSETYQVRDSGENTGSSSRRRRPTIRPKASCSREPSSR